MSTGKRGFAPLLREVRDSIREIRDLLRERLPTPPPECEVQKIEVEGATVYSRDREVATLRAALAEAKGDRDKARERLRDGIDEWETVTTSRLRESLRETIKEAAEEVKRVTDERDRYAETRDTALKVIDEREDLKREVARLTRERDKWREDARENAAARGWMARAKSAEALAARYREALEAVSNAGHRATSHVGMANYAEREAEAHQWIREALAAAPSEELSDREEPT